MKIVDQRKPHTVPFGNLKYGDIFYDTDDTECFFMKVDIAGNDINAICLHEGTGYDFHDDELVEIVNADFIVHN